jgi:chromosome segregation ATPase
MSLIDAASFSLRYTGDSMRRRLACCFLIVLAAARCSGPPVKERQEAQTAVEAARSAGAATYDSEDLQAADASLKRYDDAVAQRDYRQALNEALEARERADEATKQANAAKAELRTQADKLTTQLQTLIKTANSRLAGPGSRGTAAERLRSALRTANTALQDSRSRREAEDYRATVDALTRGVSALQRELPASEPPAVKRKK